MNRRMLVRWNKINERLYQAIQDTHHHGYPTHAVAALAASRFMDWEPLSLNSPRIEMSLLPLKRYNERVSHGWIPTYWENAQQFHQLYNTCVRTIAQDHSL